jgi:hypothetical protein
MEDLPGFKQMWKANVEKYYTGYPDKILIQLMQGHCIPLEMGKGIENAGNLGEVFLEMHIDEQMNFIDGLLLQLLRIEGVESKVQILSKYDRIADGLGECRKDLLTLNQVEILLMVMPKRVANYWRMVQLNATVDELPVAVHNFIHTKVRKLRSDVSRVWSLQNSTAIWPKKVENHAWKDPALWEMSVERTMCLRHAPCLANYHP